MTDTEKLTELLRPWIAHLSLSVAKDLIANGVTVQQWTPASQPPEDWKGDGGYLTNYYVYTPEYGVDIGNYMKPANKWLCMGIPCNVTHWMPLPSAEGIE